ncbi:phage major capsid protein [Oceanibaculum indicum]|uniref:HK97 family phage major capsid protein n=1 Tax=Oceanibaculum indicum TaxID=526216 RepID=A0A420WGP7_9PROT|nr:phage major capsid protein [Oceanibaculum indicum]RKQ70129.1 HK97 family phage major capsid protein [Oceanibaculum indicum]
MKRNAFPAFIFGCLAFALVAGLMLADVSAAHAATAVASDLPRISAETIAYIGAGAAIGSIAAYERKDDGAGGDTMSEIKRAVSEFMSGFEEFKKTNDERLKQIEKKGVVDPTTEAKLQKIEKDMARGEEISAKLVAQEQEQKAMKDQLDEVEKKLNRPQRPTGEQAAAEFKKTVNNWARAAASAITVGVMNLPEEQRKALDDVAVEHKSLNVTNDQQGGYLAPTEFVREIIKGETEITPIRQVARIRSTVFKSVEIPVRTGQFSAQRVTENGPRSETAGLAYGLKEMGLPEMYAIVDISSQMLEDSAFDMEAEIRMEATEQFSVREGYEAISGTGVGEMEGLLINSSIAETVSGAATDITADGILTLKYGIKSAYARNATFMMNRTVMGKVRRLKDGVGQYLWQPGIAEGRPNTLDGDPYVEAPDMPNTGAGTYPILYGDFRRGYLIADRIAMTMMRDPYTQAGSGNVRFWFRRRVNGQVILAEAIRKMKCATA